MKNIYIISLLILLFRFFDLYTTKLAVNNFSIEEQNLIVKFLNLNIIEFFIFEFFLAIIFVFCYIYSSKKSNVFKVEKTSFKEYVNYFFFMKDESRIIDWLFKIKFNKVIILFGSIVPVFILTTSTLFSVNNIWVFLFNRNNEVAIRYYLRLNDFYFFDILIFVFPPLFLIYLLCRKLYNSYLLNKYKVN